MMINSFHPGLLMILIGMLILVLQDRFKKPCSIIAAASGILGLFTRSEEHTSELQSQ